MYNFVCKIRDWNKAQPEFKLGLTCCVTPVWVRLETSSVQLRSVLIYCKLHTVFFFLHLFVTCSNVCNDLLVMQYSGATTSNIDS